MNKNTANFIAGVLITLASIFLILQLVPYGRAHHNPPVLQEPPWDSPITRELTVRACYDCHSNVTVWPWYSNFAPSSWIVHRDVDGGREDLNFSEWGSQEVNPAEIIKSIKDDSMPTKNYLLMHPEARLSGEEFAALLEGFEATFGTAESDE